MKRYLRLFETHSDYETYKQSQDALLPNVSYCIDNKDVHYNIEKEWKEKYLTFTATSNGTLTFTYPATLPTEIATYVEYSTDNGTTWNRLNNEYQTETEITINNITTNDEILWRGINSAFAFYNSQEGDLIYSLFTSTCNYNLSGNIMSLLYGRNFKNQTALIEDYTFAHLFHGAYIENTENLLLPATTLSNHCYEGMFTLSSIEVPIQILPATTLSQYAYNEMYNECYSLAIAPILPATQLNTYAYARMFHGCIFLRYVKAMFIDDYPTENTYNWLFNVAENGLFIKNANATWDEEDIIPTGWTVQTATE